MKRKAHKPKHNEHIQNEFNNAQIKTNKSYPNITDILFNAIYERTGNTKKTYLRRLSSHNSPAPENPEKSTYMLIIGGTRHRDQMKRQENQNNIPRKNTVQRK